MWLPTFSHLASVGGIGQTLCVADHTGTEDDFAAHWPNCSEGSAFENSPVLQDEPGTNVILEIGP